jgi:hypothetical protein
MVSTTTPSGTATTVTTASGRTGLSTITADTTPAGASVARIQNPARDAEFDSITLRVGGARQIMRDHRPPMNDAGNEFCCRVVDARRLLSYVWPANNPPAFASAAERTRLLAYVRSHLQAPAAGDGASA